MLERLYFFYFNKINLISNILFILVWLVPINFWKFEFKSFKETIKKKSRDDLIECVTDFETSKVFKIVSTLFNFYIPLIGMLLIYFLIFRVKKIKFTREFFNKEK